MNYRAKVLPALLLLIVGIGACCGGLIKRPGLIQAPAVLPLVEKVVKRHDAYAKAQEMPEATQWLLESASLLVGVQGTPEVTKDWLEAHVEPVATRHDQWVLEDTTLLEYQRSIALRSTEILRDFYTPGDQ
jgi:hypothetical protein